MRKLTERQKLYISVGAVIFGLIVVMLFCYLTGWWTGYRHGVSVNPELFQNEMEILGIQSKCLPK